MAQKITRFWLYLKLAASGSMLYVTLASMIITCLIIYGIGSDDHDDLRIGYVSEAEDPFNDSVTVSLKNRGYEVVSYDDEDELKDSILKGEAEYGFIVRANIRKAVSDDDTDRTVTFLTTPFGIYGEVVKESFAEAYLAAISEYIIEDEAYKVFDTEDEGLPDRLKEKNSEYLSSEMLFDVNVIECDDDGSDSDPNDPGRFPYILAVIGICVFVSAFSVYGRTYKGDIRAVLGCMSRSSRPAESVLCMLASSLPVAMTGIIIVLITSDLKTALGVLLKLAVLIVYSIVFTMMIGRIVRREDTYIAMIPVIIGIQVMFCLIYINMKDYMPMLSVLRFLFPASIIL